MKKLIIFSLVLILSLMLCACSKKQAEENTPQHNYVQGVCSDCGEAQPGYKSLLSSSWVAAGLTQDGEELDVINLCFDENGPYLRAEFYGLLSELSPEKQEEKLKNPDQIIEYKKNKYYYKGFGETCPFTYEEEGNEVTIEVINGKNVGYIVMERKSVDKYTVLEVTGIIFDDIITSCVEANSTFQAVDAD